MLTGGLFPLIKSKSLLRVGIFCKLLVMIGRRF